VDTGVVLGGGMGAALQGEQGGLAREAPREQQGVGKRDHLVPSSVHQKHRTLDPSGQLFAALTLEVQAKRRSVPTGQGGFRGERRVLFRAPCSRPVLFHLVEGFQYRVLVGWA